MERFFSSLSIQTLVVALSLVYLGSLAFSLTLYAVRKTFPGARQWLGGQGLLALGVIGLAAQILGLPYEILVIANVALLGSVILMGHALWRFRGDRRFPLAVYGILPISFGLWFAMAETGVGPRIVLFSGLLAAISLLDAWILLHRQERGFRAAYAMASLYFFIVALLGVGRAVATLLGNMPLSLYNEGRMGAIAYMLAILTAFFNLFGYFIMSAVRTERELKETGIALQERNQRLMRVVSMKDALISVLGHDLRGPLASAAHYTRNQLLEYSGDLNDKRESVATLAEGLDRASSLLENLVEWARGESGKLELNHESLSLAHTASEAAADVASVADDKGVTISLPENDLMATADSRATVTVFRNLLSNSVKYCREGGTVSVRLSVGPNGRPTATVQDDGIGLRPEQIERMFQPGRTILTLGTNGEQGTGMGLALCKAFLEAMGSTIRAEQTPTGARFVVTFQGLSGNSISANPVPAPEPPPEPVK